MGSVVPVKFVPGYLENNKEAGEEDTSSEEGEKILECLYRLPQIPLSHCSVSAISALDFVRFYI